MRLAVINQMGSSSQSSCWQGFLLRQDNIWLIVNIQIIIMDKLFFSQSHTQSRKLPPSLPKLRHNHQQLRLEKTDLLNITTEDLFKMFRKRVSYNNNTPTKADTKKMNTTFFKLNTSSQKNDSKIQIFDVCCIQNKRNYNQDRYCCVPVLQKPQHIENSTKWSECSYFAIFDGHGGSCCADYLNQNLNHYVVRQKNFMNEPIKAIQNAFRKIQKDFLQLSQSKPILDKSGSCALACFLFQQKMYVANVGDSHCIAFKSGSKQPFDVNIDHKPNNKKEFTRIIVNGGKLIRDETYNRISIGKPSRIYPGCLNVSRTIGDIQAKLKKYGGLPNVISSQPEIFEVETQDLQYILMGSDGLFQGLTKNEIHNMYLALKAKKAKYTSWNEFVGYFVKTVSEQAAKRCNDNITVIMIMVNCPIQ